MSDTVAYLRFSSEEQLAEFERDMTGDLLKKMVNTGSSSSIQVRARLMFDKLPTEPIKRTK